MPKRKGKEESPNRLRWPQELTQPVIAPGLKAIYTLPAPGVIGAEYDRTLDIKAMIRESSAFIEQERQKKLRMLFRQFGIKPDTPDAWEKLAIALAETLFAGLRVQKRPGNKTIWTYPLLYRLWCEVRETMLRTNEGAMFACLTLSKKEPWQTLLKRTSRHTAQHEYLYKQYEKARHIPPLNSLVSLAGDELTESVKLTIETRAFVEAAMQPLYEKFLSFNG